MRGIAGNAKKFAGHAGCAADELHSTRRTRALYNLFDGMAPVANTTRRRAMNKLIGSALLASVVVMFGTGCVGIMSGTAGSAAVASLYTQVNGAVIAGAPVGQTSGTSKVGTAESTAIICVATGDSSVQKAMENGGITKIHHVDCKIMNVLGLYVKYTTVVYGE
jgi:hypothetical protein